MHAEEYVGLQFLQNLAILFSTERLVHANDRHDFEEVEVDMVQERRSPLDPIIEPDTEGIKLVRVFQGTMKLRRSIQRRHRLGPFLEGTGAHIVATPRARR